MHKKKKLILMPVEEEKLGIDNKEVSIYHIKNFVAQFCFGSIFVDDLFRKYTTEEKKATIFHEIYHGKFLTPFKKVVNFILFGFNMKKAKWDEEFNADLYALKNTNTKAVLGFLSKGKGLYLNGLVKYNPKTHPSIEERIRRIKAEVKKGEIKLRRK